MFLDTLRSSNQITKELAIELQTIPTQTCRTMEAAGLVIRDAMDMLYNFAPEDPVINETLDQLEFYLLGETPAPNPQSLSQPVKAFFAATLEDLVRGHELAEEYAWHYIGALGLEAALRQNALARSH